MTHKIRQKVINELGQQVTKIFKVEGELGSGLLDKNGREIFEGDILKIVWDEGEKDACKVEFQHGQFWVFDEPLDDLLYGAEVSVID